MRSDGETIYPKVDFQIAAAAELAVADLIRHGHLVVSVEVLVKALAGMCLHLDVVRGCEAYQAKPEGYQTGEGDHMCFISVEPG